jgi:chromate transport protein ChrA
VVQAIVLGIVFYFAWKKMKSLPDFFAWITIALLLFIAFNSYINAYFYFFIFFLLILQWGSAGYYHSEKSPATPVLINKEGIK